MKDKIKEFTNKYKLPVFLGSAVALAAALVSISMAIYYSSGAYQLDLSRPEYKGVRSQIEPDRKSDDMFDAQGEVNPEVLDGFLDLYQEEADKALKSDAYSADVLSNEQLGI